MSVESTLFLPELREMLAEHDEAGLREFCEALPPARTADFMDGLTPQECWTVLQYAKPETRVEIFTYLPHPMQVEIIATHDRDQVAALIAELAPDDRVDVLNDVAPDIVQDILARVPAVERRDILRLQAYPEGTAGSVMTTDVAKLAEHLTVRQALDELSHQAGDLETIYYLYIVDEGNHLHGLVSARQLVTNINKPNKKLSDLMETELVVARATEDQEEVARKVARYDLLAIPVVDEENRLVGIITYDDIIDVMVEEATEDALKMGGVTPLAENYLEAPFLEVWRKRAGWLSLLFLAELFTFSALAHFEDAIAAVLALSLFVPLCISTGGNSGSQAATLLTRALAVGDVRLGDWFRVFRHELFMGLALGATLGAIGYVRAALTPASVLGNADRWDLAAVIGLSVAAICLWGTLVGSTLPLVFRRLGFDPGYASSPFVATFVDVTGIVIYFSIAKLYLL